MPSTCCAEPAPAHTIGCRKNALSMRTTTSSGSGKGGTAPGAKPVAASTSWDLATFAELAWTAAAIFSGSPRRSPGTSATTGLPSHTNTSDFTIWASSHPTASAASCAVCVPSGNCCTRASAPESRRNAETRSTGSGSSCVTSESVHERDEPVSRPVAVARIAGVAGDEEPLLDARLERPDDGEDRGREERPRRQRERNAGGHEEPARVDGVADDGVRPFLDQSPSLRRLREGREPGAERPTRQHEHQCTAEEAQRPDALEPPARGVRPAGSEQPEHEDRGDEHELEDDPTATARAEPGDVSQVTRR